MAFHSQASTEPPFPFIPKQLVASTFGDTVTQRSGAYASPETITRAQWITSGSGKKGELVAMVAGSNPMPYHVRVSVQKLADSYGDFRASIAGKHPEEPPHPEEFQAFEHEVNPVDDLTLWMPGQSMCSCPVGMNCKHGAALALYAAEQAEKWAITQQTEEKAAPAAGGEPPAEQWYQVLGPLMRETDEDTEPEVPLALGFELMSEQLQPSRFSWGHEPLTAAHLQAGKNIFLSVRPLKRGKRNNWVKGGLSWRSFEFRVADRGFDPLHADALTRIFALAESERSHTYGAVDQLWVNTFRSHLVWEALVRARDAGVECVGLENVRHVRIGESASVELDLRGSDADRAQSGPMSLHAVARIDGTIAEDARMLGGSGVIAIHQCGDRNIFDIDFAGTTSPVAQHVQKLLNRDAPLVIPGQDRELFFNEALPRLVRATSVNSSDGSVSLPAPKNPLLKVHAHYAGANALTLSWLWEYPSTRRRFSMHSRSGAGRDITFEDELLAQVREFWPTVGGALPGGLASAPSEGTERLNDVDTAVFTSHALPQLEAMADVEVEISGTRHHYRELDGAPQVRVSQTHNAQKNDWFDLGFTVTIDDRTIPFPSLFVALAKGQSKLLLEDRTYFSLDHPAFDALRALIAEGEALAEWEPNRQQISKYQVGLWEDVAAAADVAEAAEGWKHTVGKLKSLAALPRVATPRGLTATLRPYQDEGFQYLAFLYSLGLGGILADDMGLGKTMQALALIQHAIESRDVADRGMDAQEAKRETATVHAPFLVVAPSSVVGVWHSEAATYAPGLKVVVVDKTRRSRGAWLSTLIAGADVVITSYTILRIDADEFAREEFSGMVLDEAQFVKNRLSRVHQSAKRIKAPFRLAITGTPMENSLSDLWSIMSLVAPGVLGTHAQFRTQYTQPIESGEHPEKMSLLRRRVRPFMLRRTKEVVAKDLPEKQEQVLRIELESAHRKLYDSVLQRERKKVLGLLDDMDKNRFIVFRSLTLLRMLALDPAIVDDGAHAAIASSKLNVMCERLDEILAEGHRVLIFSQFTSFLARVATQLERRGVPFQYLDGSTRNRPEVIHEFREGDAPVFLISLKAGGFGLTLTEADYVFLLDPWWNPAAENQAIDRAHRIGQRERVMVYRLVAQDTIEEKVLALQEKKRQLFDALTDDGSAFSESLSVEDVRGLFE